MVCMDTIDPNDTRNTKENKWANNMISKADLVPIPLKYLLIFAVTAFVTSAAAYYINPTGLLCGVLAVLIYRWK